MEEFLVFHFFLSLLFSSVGSQSLWLLSTYIHGETQFPKFSSVACLDDITVGYYNNTYIAKGNTTNEDDVIDPDYIKGISHYMYDSFLRRSALFRLDNSQKDNVDVYQTLIVCELLSLEKPGKMIISDAARGSTTDELCYFNNTFTYTVTANITQNQIKPHLEQFKHEFAKNFYPVCIKTLKIYVNKRESQLNKKLTPTVQLIQKADSHSGGFRVSCLATGFYPRHLNLSLFRDGQLVSDHEVTGGDLLPNGDGTYQMRKSLEISGEERHKHTYSCSATHLSLDNKLDITLELDHGVPLKVLVPSVLTVLALVLVCSFIVLYKLKKRRTASSDYTTSSKTEECEQLEAAEMSETPLN